MTRRRKRTILFAVLGSVLLSLAAPVFAAPIPSRAPETAPTARGADVVAVRSFLARDDVARALAGAGLTAPQVDQRLARLSDEDLRLLAANLDQVQAAGAEVPKYIWWLLAGFLGVLILTAIF
jgi:hypothetical protein